MPSGGSRGQSPAVSLLYPVVRIMQR